MNELSEIENELILIGKRIRQIRKHRKISQIELDIATGISHADISRVENGKQNVELLTLIRLANALKVPLLEFFIYNGDVPK